MRTIPVSANERAMHRFIAIVLAVSVILATMLTIATPAAGQTVTPAVEIEASKALVRRYFEIAGGGNLNDLAEVVSPDLVIRTAPPGEGSTLESLTQTLAAARTGLPDFAFRIDDLFAEGDMVVVRTTISGTHLGDFFGAPPTGKRVETTAIDLWRVADGKLIENWHFEDILNVMRQLGAIPAGAATPANANATLFILTVNTDRAASEALVRRYYEIASSGDFDALTEVLAPEFVIQNAPLGEDAGFDGLKFSLERARVSRPDFAFRIDDLVIDGDMVVVRTTISGTHLGDFFGVPATGKWIEIAAIDLWQITDGKLAAVWHLEDILDMMRQIGVIPSVPDETRSSAISEPANNEERAAATADSVEANVALARRFHDEIFAQGNLDIADEILAPEFIWHNDVAPGVEDVKAFAEATRTAIPDLVVTADQVLAEGDRVAILWSLSGTHQGEYLGAPATGNQIWTQGIDIYRIADGKIAELWTVGDTLGLLFQLGALPQFGGEADSGDAEDAQVDPGQGDSAAEATIRAIPEQIETAWAAGDGVGIAALFTEDADFIVGDGQYWKGREEIATSFEELFDSWFKDSRVAAEVQSFRFLSDDVALMQTSGGIMMPGETEVTPEALGIQTFVVTNVDGQWLVTAYQNTRILPQQ